MGYSYDNTKMEQLFSKALEAHLKGGEWERLVSRKKAFLESKKVSDFNLTFALISRLITDKPLSFGDSLLQHIESVRKGLKMLDYDTRKLARIWWLLQYPADDEENYVNQIDSLFRSAEVNEQCALYSALPLLAFPESFTARASIGLRTAMKKIFQVIALNNPFPAEYMDEAAWNQMVLKAFFVNAEISQIMGLDDRANKTLAHILSDYAHERWAAKRPVNPQLWRPVGKFVDDKIIPDIERLFHSENPLENKAAALACAQSDFVGAKELLNQHPTLKEAIHNGVLSWGNFRNEK